MSVDIVMFLLTFICFCNTFFIMNFLTNSFRKCDFYHYGQKMGQIRIEKVAGHCRLDLTQTVLQRVALQNRWPVIGGLFAGVQFQTPVLDHVSCH